MTMLFRTVKDSLINNVLGPAELGRYQTVGFQRQIKAASEALDSSRMVQVYFSSGEFNRQGGRALGAVKHDITFKVELTVAKAAEGDLATLNSGVASAAQKAAALFAFQEGSAVADESFDELADIVFQILMDARNHEFGLPKGTVANRWISQIQKDQPVPQGELVLLSGSLLLSCRVMEQITGDEGIKNKLYDTTIDLDGDDVEKTGVGGDLGG